MPAKSVAQQRFMGMVRAAQKGKLKDPSPEVQRAASSMSKQDAKDFATTKHTDLPQHVKKEAAFAMISLLAPAIISRLEKLASQRHSRLNELITKLRGSK